MSREQIIEKLSEIVTPLLNEKIELSEECSLINDLGLDSVDMVDIVISIEDAFSVEFVDEELDSFKTVEDLVNLIVKKKENGCKTDIA